MVQKMTKECRCALSNLAATTRFQNLLNES